MAVKIITDRGDLTIDNHVISKMASHIAQNCYGVVGIEKPKGKTSLGAFLKQNSGIIVKSKGKDIQIDLHIISEYGVNVNAVSKSITNSVKYELENITGCTVSTVNVFVDNVRVDMPSKK